MSPQNVWVRTSRSVSHPIAAARTPTIAYVASAARLVVVNCTTGWADWFGYHDLFIFEDAIVVTTGSIKGIAAEGGLAAGRAYGTGRRVRVGIDEARIASRRDQTADQVMAGDHLAVAIRGDTIVSAKLRRGIVNSRLLLVLHDRRRKFLWLRGHNDHLAVRSALFALLGDRLLTG